MSSNITRQDPSSLSPRQLPETPATPPLEAIGHSLTISFLERKGEIVLSRSYSSFSSVGSDHRVVSANLKRSLRVSKKAASHPVKRIDWKEVSSNSQTSKDFVIQVFNRFQPLSTKDINSENVVDVYEIVIMLTEEVALATLPKKKNRSQLNPSSSQRIADERSRLKSISLAYHKTPSQAGKIQLTMAKKDLDDAYLDAVSSMTSY